MRTNQLRIGNYLQGNNVVQVTAIFSESTVGIGIGDPYHVHTEPPFKPCLLPIPLTKEWLVKLGFKKAVYSWYEKGIFSIHLSEKRCTTENENITYNQLPFPCFVHKLQNLYYEITGEELTI